MPAGSASPPPQWPHSPWPEPNDRRGARTDRFLPGAPQQPPSLPDHSVVPAPQRTPALTGRRRGKEHRMTRASRTAVAVASGAVTLGVGLGIAGLASAAPTSPASPTPSPSASSSVAGPNADPARPGERRGGHGRFGDGLATELADKLGLDVAKVRTALQKYRDANRPTTRPEPGTRAPAEDAALAKALASKLGVDETKVTAALSEIRTARQAERTKAGARRLAAAVKAGPPTQPEGDAVKKAADAGIVHVARCPRPDGGSAAEHRRELGRPLAGQHVLQGQRLAV